MQNTSLNGDQMNIINFCMSAASLVGAVIQLAMLSGPGTEDLYREYLGKLACCHFSLVSLCFFAVGLALSHCIIISTPVVRACMCVKLFSSFWLANPHFGLRLYRNMVLDGSFSQLFS